MAKRKGLMLRHGPQPRAALFPDAIHPFRVAAAILFAARDTLWPSVQRAVGMLAFQRQVLWAVVGFVAIQVMNDLAPLKGAAQLLLHHVAVFKDVALASLGMVGHSQHDVPKVVDVPSLSPLHAVRVVSGAKTLPPKTLGGNEVCSLTAATFASANRIDRPLGQRDCPSALAAHGRARVVAFAKALSFCNDLAASAFASHGYSIIGLGA